MKRAALATLALLTLVLGGALLTLAGAVFFGPRPIVSTHLFLLLCVCVTVMAASFYFGMRAAKERIRLLLASSATLAALSSIYPLSVMAFQFSRPELAAIDIILLGVGLILLATALSLSSATPAERDEATPN